MDPVSGSKMGLRGGRHQHRKWRKAGDSRKGQSSLRDTYRKPPRFKADAVLESDSEPGIKIVK